MEAKEEYGYKPLINLYHNSFFAKNAAELARATCHFVSETHGGILVFLGSDGELIAESLETILSETPLVVEVRRVLNTKQNSDNFEYIEFDKKTALVLQKKEGIELNQKVIKKAKELWFHREGGFFGYKQMLKKHLVKLILLSMLVLPIFPSFSVFNAEIMPANQRIIVAQQSGIVEYVNVIDNQLITKEDTIVKLKNVVVSDALEEAKTQRDAAEIKLSIIRNQNTVTGDVNDIRIAAAELDVYKKQTELAERRFNMLDVSSSRQGRVRLTKALIPGMSISAGDQLGYVGDSETYEVFVSRLIKDEWPDDSLAYLFIEKSLPIRIYKEGNLFFPSMSPIDDQFVKERTRVDSASLSSNHRVARVFVFKGFNFLIIEGLKQLDLIDKFKFFWYQYAR